MSGRYGRRRMPSRRRYSRRPRRMSFRTVRRVAQGVVQRNIETKEIQASRAAILHKSLGSLDNATFQMAQQTQAMVPLVARGPASDEIVGDEFHVKYWHFRFEASPNITSSADFTQDCIRYFVWSFKSYAKQNITVTWTAVVDLKGNSYYVPETTPFSSLEKSQEQVHTFRPDPSLYRIYKDEIIAITPTSTPILPLYANGSTANGMTITDNVTPLSVRERNWRFYRRDIRFKFRGRGKLFKLHNPNEGSVPSIFKMNTMYDNIFITWSGCQTSVSDGVPITTESWLKYKDA